MIAWLGKLMRLLADGRPVMMVTVVSSTGSVPRGPGSRMLVHDEDIELTIGGGKLEFEAMACARKALAAGGGAHLQNFTLGPQLGQCCGGAATMLFEPFSPADAAWIEKLCAVANGPRAAVRIVRLGADGTFQRNYMNLAEAEEFLEGGLQVDVARAKAAPSGFHADLEGGACKLVEILRDERQPVWLFGAGHVGRAVAAALEPLPFALTWVDSREDGFPSPLPVHADIRRPAMPEFLVDDAPAGAMFLVMTHSHAIDQDICEAVLRRGDAAYLGLIGSKTKDARFRSRFRARGLNEATIACMTCPIGLPDLRGKEPATIAASVAADLLLRLQAAGEGTEVREHEGNGLNV